jgi:ascorbate-specific PTS system EIIC-type component UlaA
VFEAPIANLKRKLDLALKSTIGGVVAFAAALVALGFFCAAAFMWLAERYGGVTAALVLGGIFTFIALMAVITILILQRRAPPPPPPRKAAPLWADPALLATALDLTRVFGRKRLSVAVLVGAFAVGMLLQKTSRKREDDSAE